MNFSAFLNTVTTRNFSLPIVILYVTAGCNLRCIMCSYRDPLPDELTLDEIKNLADELSRLGLHHIVYSGGEPLTRRDFPAICEVFQSHRVRQSLLTNGLLLHKRYEEIQSYFSEIIVSVDGPRAEIHNRIRGVDSFRHIVKGIQKITSSEKRPRVSMRTVVQRMNFREVGNMVDLAKSLSVDRISFLAADVLSDAFHRDDPGLVSERGDIMLSREEAAEFRVLVQEFAARYRVDIENRFISESPEKLFHLVQYFEALAGTAPFPQNVCNAPMVSAVISSTGDLLPCFFLPPFGNIRSAPLQQEMNNARIRSARHRVREYSLTRCHECVCTLHVDPLAALMDRF